MVFVGEGYGEKKNVGERVGKATVETKNYEDRRATEDMDGKEKLEVML